MSLFQDAMPLLPGRWLRAGVPEKGSLGTGQLSFGRSSLGSPSPAITAGLIQARRVSFDIQRRPRASICPNSTKRYSPYRLRLNSAAVPILSIPHRRSFWVPIVPDIRVSAKGSTSPFPAGRI